MTQHPTRAIDAVIVLHESASVIDGALDALAGAAPRSAVNTIVVDNASTDRGPAIAASGLGEGSVIRSERNLGFAGGVNLGLARSTHPWIALVNPDLRYAPGALDRLLHFMEAQPEVGFAGSRLRISTSKDSLAAGPFVRRFRRASPGLPERPARTDGRSRNRESRKSLE